jgi:CubicO group peptidase (beta-lactamase class C family)
MKNPLLIFVLLFLATNSLLSQSSAQPDAKTDISEIDKLMQYSYENGMFNGDILVTEQGKPIYKKALGYADKNSGRKLNNETVFYLASVSKQFTTMAIMILKEQNKLSYDDHLSKYFPEFPAYADSVTIKQLMTHTSGIPDHYQLGVYKKGLSNDDVLEILLKQEHLNFKPGDEFRYSNGGYVLLSLIVEKASETPFPEFMKTNIFEPLGMKNTLVYDKSTPEINNRAVGYNLEGGLDDYEIFTTGAGGMYSTLDDLHLWDQALYTEKLVSKSTLDEAFTSATLKNGDSTHYGYGWAVSDDKGQKVVQHSGSLSGYRTFLRRNVYNNSGYIILTNYGSAYNDLAIREALNNILEGKPYMMPKIPISRKLAQMLKSDDTASVIKEIHVLLDSEPDKYEADEYGINPLGYTYLANQDMEKALAVFKLNVDYFPKSFNVYDSYGEALMKNNEIEKAIINYRKSVELNPDNTNGIEMLKKLEAMVEKD